MIPSFYFRKYRIYFCDQHRQAGEGQYLPYDQVFRLICRCPQYREQCEDTAEQSKGRANHATFIAYAPAEQPKVALSVAIPNGYGSSYSGALSEQILSYYFGYVTLDSILENNRASDADLHHVSD